MSSVNARILTTFLEDFVKTIISRLTRVQDLDSSELSKIVGAYREIGIEVLKDAETFKSFDQILAELSGKWDSLTDVQKKYIGFLSAGKLVPLSIAM